MNGPSLEKRMSRITKSVPELIEDVNRYYSVMAGIRSNELEGAEFTMDERAFLEDVALGRISAEDAIEMLKEHYTAGY